MKSFGTVLSVILTTAVVVGGILYFYYNDKLSDQKTDLSGQVEELKNKLSDVPEEKVPETQVAAPKAEEVKPEPAVPATAEPSALVQAADTSKWKTFTSSKFDYSIKYPLDWVYSDATAGVPISIIGFKPKGTKDGIFNITIEKSTLDFTIARIKK
ncbi:MAG TPA: hypothetical protein PK263_06465, partial [bacterium]|nr:hypothetical protein [bacterium]